MLKSLSDETALKSALIYTALIFGMWSIYVAFLYSSVESNPNVATRILLNEFVRFCIFVAPVFLYLKFVAHQEPFHYLKLRTNISGGVLWGLVIAVIYAALILARIAVFSEDGISLKPIPFEAWFTAITIATLIEEIAFRGFLLQQFGRITNFWTANAVTAFLFAAIHFPGWFLLSNSTPLSARMAATAELFFVGLLLGYLFKRTDSLWSCIVVHAANNLAAIIFFG